MAATEPRDERVTTESLSAKLKRWHDHIAESYLTPMVTVCSDAREFFMARAGTFIMDISPDYKKDEA